jgi:hypothetical protein
MKIAFAVKSILIQCLPSFFIALVMLSDNLKSDSAGFSSLMG